MNDISFQLREANKERIMHERIAHNKKNAAGEYIYTTFCVWCNCRANSSELKNSPKAFAEFLKTENIVLTFWQRKAIAETYFGYKFEWDNANGKWEIRKKQIKKS